MFKLFNRKPKPKYFIRDAKNNKKYSYLTLDEMVTAYETSTGGEPLSATLLHNLEIGFSVFSGPRWYFDVAGAVNTITDTEILEIWRERNV